MRKNSQKLTLLGKNLQKKAKIDKNERLLPPF